jgi:hypothetical protein
LQEGYEALKTTLTSIDDIGCPYETNITALSDVAPSSTRIVVLQRERCAGEGAAGGQLPAVLKLCISTVM